MNAQLVFLIGYRGAGKSVTARLLADRLGWQWLDADAVLETRCGRSIRELFAEEGEASFRNLEAQILRELAALQQHVIATGGGVILRPENREQLKRGKVVWLRADAAVLWQRLQLDQSTADRRPNLAQGGLAEIEELLRVRTPLYKGCQDFTVNAGEQTPEQIAESVLAWLRA